MQERALEPVYSLPEASEEQEILQKNRPKLMLLSDSHRNLQEQIESNQKEAIAIEKNSPKPTDIKAKK